MNGETMRKRTTLLAAAAAGVIGATALAAPANASITFYDGTRFTAGWINYYGSETSYAGLRFSSGVLVDNHISSANNTQTTRTCLYANANYTGNWFPIGPGVDLFQLSSAWNNALSSHRFNC